MSLHKLLKGLDFHLHELISSRHGKGPSTYLNKIGFAGVQVQALPCLICCSGCKLFIDMKEFGKNEDNEVMCSEVNNDISALVLYRIFHDYRCVYVTFIDSSMTWNEMGAKFGGLEIKFP